MDETKVHYGIAKAHQMMLTISNYIEAADLSSLNSLLSWKETRSNIALDPVIGKALGFLGGFLVCVFLNTLDFASFLMAKSFSFVKVYSVIGDFNYMGNFICSLCEYYMYVLLCYLVTSILRKA